MDPYYGLLEEVPPDFSRLMGYKSKKAQKNPDYLTIGEALCGEHRDDWITALENEIQELEDHKTWEIVK